MKLVDDWKGAWRWFSMHALVLAGVIPTVWAELPLTSKPQSHLVRWAPSQR